MLDRVWTNKKPRPSLHFLRDAETSYYSTVDHAIAIASHQQDYATFLHEIVHAEGLWDHDSRFMRRYISLLALHARCDECKLRLAAGLFGIKM